MKLQKLIRNIYYSYYWVQNNTPGNPIWFTNDNQIAPEGYTGDTSNTASPKNWKAINALMDEMIAKGSTKICISKFTYVFGKRRITDWIWESSGHPEGNLATPAEIKQQMAEEIEANYNQLLLAVEMKYPNESRFDTALRLIKESQQGSLHPQKQR